MPGPLHHTLTITGRTLSSRQSVSRVRVRYAETDKMGVVYYANYLVWFEVARTDLLREAGWTYREMEAEGFALPVIEAHCEYRQSARYDEELDVRTTGSLLSPIRIEFAYEVVRPGNGALVALGRTVHAALDAGGRPCRLPQRARALFDADCHSRAEDRLQQAQSLGSLAEAMVANPCEPRENKR